MPVPIVVMTVMANSRDPAISHCDVTTTCSSSSSSMTSYRWDRCRASVVQVGQAPVPAAVLRRQVDLARVVPENGLRQRRPVYLWKRHRNTVIVHDHDTTHNVHLLCLSPTVTWRCDSQGVGFRLERSRLRLPVRSAARYRDLGKLFTHACLCHRA